MESKRTATTYFIPPGKFLLMENALGNPDLIQSSVSSDCRVTIVDIANFPLDELEQWPTFRLTSPDIKLKLGEGSYYIYIVVPTPDNTETNTAFISYNTAWVDRYGYDADGKLIGKEKFCYYQCGIVSARGGNAGAVTVPPGKGRRIDIDLGVNPQDAALEKKVDWDYLNKMFKPHFDNPDNPEELTWIEALSNLGVAGGVNSYIQSKGMDIPGIYDGLPIDNITLYWELLPDGKKVLKSLGTGSSDTPGGGVADSVAWSNITGKPTWLLDNKIHYSEIDGTPDLSSYASKEWIAEQSFASSEALDSLQNTLNTFLTGSDVDDVINKWRELETFLSGMKESDNLSSILKGKADSATTLAGYGIADAYTKTEVDKKLSSYVTLDGKQTVTGEKNFTGGLKVNGMPLFYDPDKKYWKLDGDLLVTGGVASYSSDETFKPSTVMDGVLVDDVTIRKNDNGRLEVIGGNGGLNLDELSAYLYDNEYVNSVGVSGSGNAVTSASISGNKLTLTKGSMFALASDLDSYAKKATTLAGYGIANAYTKTEVDSKLSSYVTLDGKQTITGEKNFTGGLKVNGMPLFYDPDKKYWKLDGDLLVTGGVASYSSDETFKPSTVMDGVLVDDVTIRKNDNGRLEVIGGNGGLNLDELSAYLYDNEYVNSVGVSGSGNAVTSASISGNKLTLTKGSMFALSSDLDSYAKKSTTLAGYGIANAYTKIESDGKFLVKTNSEYYGVDFNSTLEDGSVRILLLNGGDTRVGIGYASKRAYLTNYVTGKELWIEDKLSFNGEGAFESLYIDGKTYAKGGLEVTGSAYFGGGTTYYFGSTGNVKCAKLTATGETNLEATTYLKSNVYVGGEVRAIAPEGATYTPWRIVQNDTALYIQAATKDGVNNRGKMYLTGMNAVKLEMLKLSSESTEVLGKLSVDDVLTSNVADGTAPLVVKSTTKVTNLNADMVDGFSVAVNGMAYRSLKSVTDTSGSVWYLKVKFNKGWNSGLHKVEVAADYNNINGKVFLELDSYNQNFGYNVKVSNYNGCNCTAFCYAHNTSDGIGYVYLRFVGHANAYAQVKSTLEIDTATKMTATEAASISWIELESMTMRSSYNHILGSSLSVGKSIVLSESIKSVYEKTSYTTFQNHNNGNISVNAATGDLYLGYVNTKSVVCSSPVIPYNHNELKLGTSAKRWQCVYGVNGDFTSQMSAKTLKVNGGNLTFDPSKLAWQLEGDLVVTGGVASYSSLSSFTPSTIMDGVLVDDKTIKKNTDGKLEVIGGTGGGSGNIKTVSALPSNPQPDTLYILV